MVSVFYATREDVKSALDVKETARNNRQIDRLIDFASRSIEGLCHRKFYPELDTRYFAWPDDQMGRSYRLWLNKDELISVTSVTAGGTTIASTDYFLEPVNSGPPYTRLEIDLSSSAYFDVGDTHQRNIAITGTFGYRDDSESAGTLAEVLDSSETSVDVSDASLIGVGDVIKIDDERMIVTNKQMVTSGQSLQTTVTAMTNSETIAVTDGTAYAVDEVILIDSERMLIVDIAGNNLTVKRAWDGSTLAAHNSGATIYALRTLTVTRGALGTTAAAHNSATAITRHVVPSGIRTLCVAEVVWALQQETSGFGRFVGAGMGTTFGKDDDRRLLASAYAIEDLRNVTRARYGRSVRIGAI